MSTDVTVHKVKLISVRFLE